MVIVIEFDNGDMVPVCFGEFHNRTILYNGVVMRPDSTLYDFVLLNIYSKYLPRNWVIENTLETSNDINNQLRDFLRKDTTSLLEMIPYEEDIIQ